jgi:hypothetical protein
MSFAVAMAGAACLLAVAPAAQATFHEIKVREVYPGSNSDSYVELQMYAAGQTFLEGHSVTLYDSSGALVHTSTFPTPSGISNGASQATVLIGDTNVQATFGVAPDLVDSGLNIPAAGGAACWIAGTLNADCVSWGSFPHPAPTFESATATSAGAPVSAGGIAAGKAIRRKITPGCSTLLEASDDTNDSATDFEEVSPAPRNNASAITEMACNAPTATIDSSPANPTSSTSAAFTYHSTPAGASFECKLDAKAFATCEPSGKAYPGPLGEGSHTFQVRAHNANGTGTPASYIWTIDTTPPIVEIKTHPNDPSPGNSAAFTYSSNEAGSTFECSLEPLGEPPAFTNCPSTGKSYPDAEHPAPLANGEWTFEVRAKDKAGNQSVPGPFPDGTFSWEVDNSLADTTPPETTITSKPPDPSESPTATFTYASNEAGSTFECKLDTGAFASCPAAGIAYSGLASGSHTFQVRAIDASSNVDPTPAGYTFNVVAFGVQIPALPTQPAPLVHPDTRVFAKPPTKTSDRTPTVRFRSNIVAAHFQCAVDRSPYRPCSSPFTTKPLALGAHKIWVRAVAAGLLDLTPAAIRFRVVHARGTR